MRNAMDEIGTDCVLFSIDYPCESMEEGSNLVRHRRDR
jgi:hypothetical protein